MDHDHNHGGGGNDSDAVSCPMIMMFHAGHCERILWKGWVASTVAEFVLSALAIFLVAFAYEALKFIREYLLIQNTRKLNERLHRERQLKSSPSSSAHMDADCPHAPLAELRVSTIRHRMFNWAHFIQTLLNLVQIVLAYLLMLVFMTFNYWLCLAVVLGLGCGYFLFGWIKQEVYEHDCCQ